MGKHKQDNENERINQQTNEQSELKQTSESSCGCNENCDRADTCDCNENCNCNENCDCDEQNNCGENCDCEQSQNLNNTKNCSCDEDKLEYLNQLQRVQAEFDNYRKRMVTALGDARQDGFMDAITQFLPALDSFKMATAMITDKNTLMGIQFIEKGILDTLQKMGVETIDATGKFDPEFHQAIDTDNSPDFESGDIVKECYKGFTYKGKVIRYAQVIVKK